MSSLQVAVAVSLWDQENFNEACLACSPGRLEVGGSIHFPGTNRRGLGMWLSGQSACLVLEKPWVPFSVWHNRQWMALSFQPSDKNSRPFLVVFLKVRPVAEGNLAGPPTSKP